LKKTRAGVNRKSVPSLHDANEAKTFIAQISDILTGVGVEGQIGEGLCGAINVVGH
jgi:hypothetical protein